MEERASSRTLELWNKIPCRDFGAQDERSTPVAALHRITVGRCTQHPPHLRRGCRWSPFAVAPPRIRWARPVLPRARTNLVLLARTPATGLALRHPRSQLGRADRVLPDVAVPLVPAHWPVSRRRFPTARRTRRFRGMTGSPQHGWPRSRGRLVQSHRVPWLSRRLSPQSRRSRNLRVRELAPWRDRAAPFPAWTTSWSSDSTDVDPRRARARRPPAPAVPALVGCSGSSSQVRLFPRPW